MKDMSAESAARRLVEDDYRLVFMLVGGIAEVCFIRGFPHVGITVRDSDGVRISGTFVVMGVTVQVEDGRARVELKEFRREAAKVGCNPQLPWEYIPAGERRL